MRESQSSTTAEFMALFRAQESAMPEHSRLFNDPFAVSFLSPRLRAASTLFRITLVRSALARWMDARWPGVDATLRSIAALAEGSQLIFTYVDADLINGADRFRDAASARRAVTGVGEPWTFGLRPEALPAYLEERGLRLVKDMSANEYRTHTMGAAAASAKGYEFYHVALVEVGGQARPDWRRRACAGQIGQAPGLLYPSS